MRRLLIATITLTLTLTSSSAQPVDFVRELQPILEAKCLGCHNPNNAKDGLSFAEASAVLDSEKSLVVPGKARESKLYLVTLPGSEGEPPEMPEKGEPLTETEAELLRRWIDEGAKWPADVVLREASKADKSWWAYQKLQPPTKESIDAYVVAKLKAEGLELNQPADARTLIRRASYDLIGLPPSPTEVRVFAKAYAEDSQTAFRSLVDRLLESPHYGERWGRHWLDVVRFGESNGFERNVIINNLWPFRDYVIRSINDDKPFDAFIREHLAGDVFGEQDPTVAIGSAFLVAGPYDDVGNQDPVASAQIRANTLDEIIRTTSEAFLGMTLGCARCHDHKFDPILQKDYYQLYATFAGIRHGEAELGTPKEKQTREAALRPLNKRKGEIEGALSTLEETVVQRAKTRMAHYQEQWTRPKVDRTGTEEHFDSVKAKYVRLICEAQDSNPNSTRFNIDEFEVWSADESPRNVALASNGGKASGPARIIEDFADAYGAHLAIDGETGARFISASNNLTIELAEPTLIDHVIFSSAKGAALPEQGKFTFVADYRLETSLDGETWREVAHGRDRQPVHGAHERQRLLEQELTAKERKERQGLRKDLREISAEIAKVPVLQRAWIGTRNAADAKGPFHLFLGGSPQKKGEEIVPASFSTLSESTPSYALEPDTREAQRRVALADWITHPENPLTLRVLANRLWHYHFGKGIVDTPNDFGYMGGRPTHPALLDFLASKLKENGWKLKEMHRLIMLSKTYQQSSAWRKSAADQDADSRWLWRFPPRRLSAEEIRDTMLVVADKLDTKMGGPGFRLYRFLQDNVSTYAPLDTHGLETYRRAVYHQNARASVVDLMSEYDQPDCAFSTPRRSQTTTPLQALTLLNHQFTIDMAEAFGARLMGEKASAKVAEAFEIAFQRKPSDAEAEVLAELLEKHGTRALCRAVLNSSELIYLD